MNRIEKLFSCSTVMPEWRNIDYLHILKTTFMSVYMREPFILLRLSCKLKKSAEKKKYNYITTIFSHPTCHELEF